MNKFILLFTISIIITSMSSCVQHRELVMLTSVNSSDKGPEALLYALQLRAQQDDLLRITVHSFNAEAAAPFNIENMNQQMQQMQQLNQAGASQGNYTMELFNGYFVDREGYISMPVLGRLKVEGLTLAQIEKLITDGTQPFLKDAVVNARFLNFKINVLGEVNKPGIVRVSNQRVSILEAIGNAGDFTPYANRTNVLLVREEAGQRSFQRLNFQKGDIFNSPYFYLKQNDMLYVEPIKAKVATVQDPFARGITYGTAFISIITLSIALFK